MIPRARGFVSFWFFPPNQPRWYFLDWRAKWTFGQDPILNEKDSNFLSFEKKTCDLIMLKLGIDFFKMFTNFNFNKILPV